MKKIALTIAAIAATITLSPLAAQSVTTDVAALAASRFLAAEEPAAPASLVHYHTYSDPLGDPVMYIFNIDTVGFVIVGADKSEPPVVGYSLNGAFDTTRLPSNLSGWLSAYSADIAAFRAEAALPGASHGQSVAHQRLWKDLIHDNYRRTPSKGVNALVSTQWDQGYGYNNLCPTYPSGFNGMNSNGHSCTGCVATAMAQIIRYYRYPTTGYSHFGYTHGTYGYMHVQFDSVNYNYDNMPLVVNYYSSAAQKQAVSQLCYHCGVAVEMDYEGPSHTTGSGAHSQDVPQALKHFGYTQSYYKAKSPNTAEWDSLLRNDLNHSRPVYYSGSSSEGSHAFICDGYRDNGTYHFNFGWGGYTDGYYTISDLNGYTNNQGAVFNIFPSNFGTFRDTIYIDASANGHGSSWSDAYPDIETALQICGLYKRGTIWVKNGVYYGNTAAGVAFNLQKNVKIYGGFNGTEHSLDDRDLASANTVMSGANKRMVVNSGLDATNAGLYNMVIANGRASDGSGLTLAKGARVENCLFENNTSTSASGAAVSVDLNKLYNCVVRNNIGGGVKLNNSMVFNTLVAHNDGFGVYAQSSDIDGCDIVCNAGVGVNNRGNSSLRNCILWRNDSSLYNNDISYITFSAIDGFGDIDSNSNFGISRVNRPDEGIGPFFIDPDTTVGPSATMGDWHLSSLSPLVNAGDTMRRTSYEFDLDGGGRIRGGRIDIGCYEWVPGNAVPGVPEVSALKLYPNPAGNTVTVEGTLGEIQIYDMTGRLLLSQRSSLQPATIHIGDLPRGVYLLRTAGTTAKLIKK